MGVKLAEMTVRGLREIYIVEVGPGAAADWWHGSCFSAGEPRWASFGGAAPNDLK
jgi:hypothetical protein